METNRLRKSIKIELEHKFIRQKAEFLDQIEKQMQIKQETLKEQIQQDHQNLINSNVKIAILEKKNDEKDKIIIEQEIIIRGYAATINQLQCQLKEHQQMPQQQAYQDIDEQRFIAQLQKQIDDLKMKNLRLHLKLTKLLTFFTEFKFYEKEFASFAVSDECSCDQLFKPKLPNNQDLLNQFIQQLNIWEEQYKKLSEKNEEISQEMKELKKKLIRHDLTTTIDKEKQTKTINILGEQVEDQKKYIAGLLWQIKQKSNTTQCKTLNDILLKKRVLSVEGDEPIFDVNKSGRKVIVDRYKLSSLQFVAKQRLHTLNN
ncbi:unnamed protein product [Paramecium sonneborni]|uniref:Uncharacterized protein n=1 Tax=Paramecium sonneborni TaxID=65129 RepID=A0A8S1KH92_9CILI|nr:unnamed protein product [Paramecium sonneborni]